MLYQTKYTYEEFIVKSCNNKVQNPVTENVAEKVEREVWGINLKDEFKNIYHVIKTFNHAAISIKHPVVVHPYLYRVADVNYQLIRSNIDRFHIIQLGLTLMDGNGNTPPGYSTWQFNFKFNLGEDVNLNAQNYMDDLKNSGVHLKKHEEDGIEPLEFAECLIASGIVSMDNIKWLSFDSSFDFGYMLKFLTTENLPYLESEFFDLLKLHFKTIYDVKYLKNLCKNLKGNLQEVGDQLKLCRVGRKYNAGSDSHLTAMVFFKIREILLVHEPDSTDFTNV